MNDGNRTFFSTMKRRTACMNSISSGVYSEPTEVLLSPWLASAITPSSE